MRRRYTSEQRSQLLELLAGGDVTVPEAAARLGVTSSSAYNWVAESRKPRRPRSARPEAAPTFVRLMPSAAADSSIVIRVAGTEIHVRRGFDSELLQAVVASLVEVAQ
jgi:transposase-like protein